MFNPRGERPLSRPGLFVVAVDGVLADTLPTRLECFLIGAAAAGLIPDTNDMSLMSPDWIAGRSWQNAARRLASELGTESVADDVAVDLAALAAEREWTRRVALGLPVVDLEALNRCRSAVTSGWRLVLRADSTRRSAAELLEHLEQETQAVRTVAGDDPGVLDELAAKSLIMSQYAGIVAAAQSFSPRVAPAIHAMETDAVRRRTTSTLGRQIKFDWP